MRFCSRTARQRCSGASHRASKSLSCAREQLPALRPSTPACPRRAAQCVPTAPPGRGHKPLRQRGRGDIPRPASVALGRAVGIGTVSLPPSPVHASSPAAGHECGRSRAVLACGCPASRGLTDGGVCDRVSTCRLPCVSFPHLAAEGVTRRADPQGCRHHATTPVHASSPVRPPLATSVGAHALCSPVTLQNPSAVMYAVCAERVSRAARAQRLREARAAAAASVRSCRPRSRRPAPRAPIRRQTWVQHVLVAVCCANAGIARLVRAVAASR
jgi:hypothetical protein